QGHLQPLVHRLQGEAHRERAHGEDTPQRLLRRGEEVPRRDDLVHQADAIGFLRVDHVSREDQAQRVTLADQPRQSLRAAVTGGDAELDLRLAELRGVARDSQVARHGELATAAQRVAVHSGDNRLAARLEAPQHCLAAQRPCLPVEWTLFRKVSDVRPRHERLLPGAREDRALDRVVGGHALGRVGQLVHHLIVQRVQLVGAVDGDESDIVADIEQESLVAHDGEWYTGNAERGTRRAEQWGQRRVWLFRVPRSAFRLPRYVGPMP